MEAEPKNNQKYKTNAILIMAVIIFAVGFGLGFYVFGYHKQTSADYKQCLHQVIDYIDAMEKEQKDLSAKIRALEAERDMLKKGAAPGVAQTSSLQARLDSLERENAFLRTSMSQNQALTQENYQLRGRLQSLEAHMNVQGTVPSIPQPQTGPPATTAVPR